MAKISVVNHSLGVQYVLGHVFLFSLQKVETVIFGTVTTMPHFSKVINKAKCLPYVLTWTSLSTG